MLLPRLTELSSQFLADSVTYSSNFTPIVASYATMAANNLRMHLFLLVRLRAGQHEVPGPVFSWPETVAFQVVARGARSACSLYEPRVLILPDVTV